MMRQDLKTAQAWPVRKNFKMLFSDTEKPKENYALWKTDSLRYSINAVNSVIATFDRHLTGIFNAVTTRSSSARHENMNGKIQSIIAKARGFINFQRFKINTLFYCGNLNPFPLNI